MTSPSILVALAFWAASPPAVDFDTEVIPVLTKAGCNAGACHGAAVGRGGFKLSLYGGDPAGDYRAIVQELEGRRINLADADESLVIMKPTGLLGHGGGIRLETDGPGAVRLANWIRQGAQRGDANPQFELDVQPRTLVLDRPGTAVPLRAVVRDETGEARDVTRWTVFTAEDPDAVKIDPVTGVAEVLRRGRNVLVARYLDRVVPVQLVVPILEEPVDHSSEPRHNFIDDLVVEQLSTLRLPVSPLADDATFLRRVFLDLTGRLPSPVDVQAFVADSNPDKRVRLIDRLLEAPEFAEYWTFQLSKLLRVRPLGNDQRVAAALHRWIKNQILVDRPYDEIARTLLTATGDSHEHGPAGFHRLAGDARGEAEFVSEVFLGVRLRCANCHNHPLDRWTQDDYHGFAAVFADLDRGRIVTSGGRGEVTHPATGAPAVPRIPGERFLDAATDGRHAFAAWLTDSENPYFARAAVNRLWKALMGRGLIEPADDLRSTNPATHPELLQRLADDFAAHGYHLRHTLRRIAVSATYQRSAVPVDGNRTDDRFYSHRLVRRLEAEVLADALSDVTGVWEHYKNAPPKTRAIALVDPSAASDTLDALGRCDRSGSCESAMGAAGGLSQKLHLINGPLINAKLTAPEGRLQRLRAAEKPMREIVEEFYVRALSRPPSEAERTYWQRQFETVVADGRGGFLEDLLWSLLNSREFVTNH